MGFIGLAAYSYVIAPDWMWMYFVDPQDVPTWIVVALFIGYFFVYASGFLLKFELEKIYAGLPWILLILSIVVAGDVVWLLEDRYQSVTTRSQFLAGIPGIPLAHHPAGTVVGAAGGVLALVGIILFFWSRRETT